MKDINDLQIGKAGEYLVCADLILNGYIAYPSEQGLPYDVVMDYKGTLLKVQVKSTRGAKEIPQRKTSIPAYIFHIGSNGRGGKRKSYKKEDVDLFALVCIETKQIAYITYSKCKSTMNFRVTEQRGNYHDEKSAVIKKTVMGYKERGYSAGYIASSLKMKLSNVYKYQANVSIEQKGTNAGVYFDEFNLNKCLCQL
jgi:hypothetical protein